MNLHDELLSIAQTHGEHTREVALLRRDKENLERAVQMWKAKCAMAYQRISDLERENKLLLKGIIAASSEGDSR